MANRDSRFGPTREASPSLGHPSPGCWPESTGRTAVALRIKLPESDSSAANLVIHPAVRTSEVCAIEQGL